MALDSAVMWTNLIQWLEQHGCKDPDKYIKLVETSGKSPGRGLVAKGAIKPATKLISIPSSALLNVKSLGSLYPSNFEKLLNSYQWVSLHIALQYARNRQRRVTSPRDRFKPFIASIPQDFPTLPLTWSLGSRTKQELIWNFDLDAQDETLSSHNEGQRRLFADLLSCMPPAVKNRAASVEKRFRQDWKRTRQVWAELRASNSEETDELCFFDFALAWKNVNTRCVYFDLGLSKDDNFTLAPVIDMINHADRREASRDHLVLQSSTADRRHKTKPLQSMSKGLEFSSPSTRSIDPPLRDGEELSFSYGAHEDAMLLTEYGFTLGAGNPFNNLDCTPVVEQLFNEQGEEGALKRGVLQDAGYWGEMTMQGSEHDASASWRVLIALRLLHLRISTSGASLTASTIEPFYAVVAGDADIISDSNEKQVKASLRTICQVIKLQADEALPRCDRLLTKWTANKDESVSADFVQSLSMLKGVWQEDLRIARAVLVNLEP
ncbi:hypothetical protein OIV83_001471 [Microbotryomycetes sp. JL201]|nr:hypothetical protein OIV83_001471 [Microbotryomycetes sp. JL201]